MTVPPMNTCSGYEAHFIHDCTDLLTLYIICKYHEDTIASMNFN